MSPAHVKVAIQQVTLLEGFASWSFTPLDRYSHMSALPMQQGLKSACLEEQHLIILVAVKPLPGKQERVSTLSELKPNQRTTTTAGDTAA